MAGMEDWHGCKGMEDWLPCMKERHWCERDVMCTVGKTHVCVVLLCALRPSKDCVRTPFPGQGAAYPQPEGAVHAQGDVCI